MKSFYILVLSLSLVGCDNVLKDVLNRFSSKIVEDLLNADGNFGKKSDQIRASYLRQIEIGLNDLKRMNDPQIEEVHKLINEKLKDNELSVFDYNTIMDLINSHKKTLFETHSRYQGDVFL